jgi:ubiquinone/menaquinone biosynthesis C-methylase UbiE
VKGELPVDDHFENVTEIGGQPISGEQLDRACHRYHWAAQIAQGKDVLEVACGAGQGLQILRQAARSVTAGDYSPVVLQNAVRTMGELVPLSVFDAEDIPFDDNSFDIALIFEAIYYLENPEVFYQECARLLKKGGKLLIVSANKDLFDFSPSPFSKNYFGVIELAVQLERAGFDAEFFGYLDVRSVSTRQRFLRPLKLFASRWNLIPQTMEGKKWLKKLYFGTMTEMPADLSQVEFSYSPPVRISAQEADTVHKVIYCSATLKS